MEREFTNGNFEHFLKQSADNLRMKAPERVWQNLSKELNKRRRRFILGLSAFLLMISTAGFLVATSNAPKQAAVSLQNNKQQPGLNSKHVSPEHNESVNTVSLATQPSAKAVALNSGIKPVIYKNNIATNTIWAKENQESNPINLHDFDVPAVQNNFTPTIVDSYSEFDEQAGPGKNELKQSDVAAMATLPLTIESVINAYKAKNKKGKLDKQFYFSPTISYRKLTENKSYLRSLDPANVPSNYAALNSSVSNNVTHKPDVGFELGFTTKLPVSNRLKLRSGIQFNVNRYDVKAFSSPLSIATIALNNGPRVDSLSTISGYSNVHGYKSNWLQNFSFQVSVPIGIEYNFSSSDKLQFGMATTIQPTYVLGDRAYLITTDYKRYTEVPWLVRRWNVNTALEAFVKYKGWQFGPQVRYQLLSSFDSKYPVKENLFDFGLKVGVSLNK